MSRPPFFLRWDASASRLDEPVLVVWFRGLGVVAGLVRVVFRLRCAAGRRGFCMAFPFVDLRGRDPFGTASIRCQSLIV